MLYVVLSKDVGNRVTVFENSLIIIIGNGKSSIPL